MASSKGLTIQDAMLSVRADSDPSMPEGRLSTATAWHSPVRETSDSVARSAVVQRSRTGYVELKPGTL
jgi:hypothetical protein